jgi:peptide/nickel transport system substrate-binding protein
MPLSIDARLKVCGGRRMAAGLCAVAVWLVASAASAQSDRRGGTLVWAMGAEPAILASYLTVAPAAAQIGAKIYDGLLDYDAGRQPVPALAERWLVARDGRSITFHLRRDVAFHDGKPFTSADVQFTILDVLRRHHPRGATIFRHVTAVETPDAHTAVLQLSEPAPYLLTALAAHESPMLPRHALSAILAGPDRAKAPLAVGTGPFKLSVRAAGQPLRLARNEHYWRSGYPVLNAIEVRFVANETERAGLAESGEAHVVGGLDTETANRVASSGHARINLDGADALAPMAALSLNTTRPPLDKQEVRQAIAHAIDRPALIASAWHGFGRPASGPAAQILSEDRFRGLPPAASDTPADALERANRLLDAAGLPRREDGIRLTLVHDVAPLGAEWQRLSEGIEQQLARVGIKVSSRFETIEAWSRRLAEAGDFTIASLLFYGLSDPVIGLHRTLHSGAIRTVSPFANSARWRNPEADRIMDRAMVELDPFRRGRHYRELQEIALQAAPYVWLVEMTPPVLVHRDVDHVLTAPLGLHGNFAQAKFIAPGSAPHAAVQPLAAGASNR